MRKHVFKFLGEEDGAVTVDWVVLTAALVGLGAIVIYDVSSGATSTANSVGSTVSTLGVGYQTHASNTP